VPAGGRGQLLQQEGTDAPAVGRVVDEHGELGAARVGEALIRRDAEHVPVLLREDGHVIGAHRPGQPIDLGPDAGAATTEEPAVQVLVAGPLVQSR
jgi:hypothetical protein